MRAQDGYKDHFPLSSKSLHTCILLLECTISRLIRTLCVKKYLITIKAQLVLLGEGTDFIFLHRGQNNFHHRLLLDQLPNIYTKRK